MFEPVGYAFIKKQTTTVNTGCKDIDLKKFQGQTVRVTEFTEEGDVMVMSSDAQTLATFDKCDVERSFKCCVSGEVLCPPSMKDNMLEQMAYVAKVTTRKGGYNHILKNMVIAASLHRREFCDSVLWAKQNHPEYSNDEDLG